MLLMWTFAEVSERPYWKAMSWAMVRPSLWFVVLHMPHGIMRCLVQQL